MHAESEEYREVWAVEAERIAFHINNATACAVWLPEPGSLEDASKGEDMAATGRDLFDRFGKLMADGDVAALTALYAADAKVVLFYRVASGRREIRELLETRLAAHGRYDVMSVDQFQDAGDLVMWDATVETDTGPMQTTHVVILNDEGLIQHHVPSIRSYWGM